MGVREILAKTIDLEKLVKEKPELFSLNDLHISDKIDLLHYDPKFYYTKLDIENSKPELKVDILGNKRLKALHKNIVITDNEVDSLKADIYNRLLKIDFQKYIKKERFAKLSKSDKAEWFISQPTWYVENMDELPRLTSEKLWMLAASAPKFIDTHISDFSSYSTRSDFWLRMIRYNEKYKEVFLRNTKTLITATDVRAVIWAYPDIVKKLDATIMADSKLTIKQWVLLIGQLRESYKSGKELEGWDFDDSQKETIRLDITADLLMGKATNSKRFSGAVSKVLTKSEEPEENEDQTMVGPAP